MRHCGRSFLDDLDFDLLREAYIEIETVHYLSRSMDGIQASAFVPKCNF